MNMIFAQCNRQMYYTYDGYEVRPRFSRLGRLPSPFSRSGRVFLTDAESLSGIDVPALSYGLTVAPDVEYIGFRAFPSRCFSRSWFAMRKNNHFAQAV